MDIRSLSDDDLRALSAGGSAPPLTIYANRKLQSLSDEDLLALAKGNAPTQPMGSDGVSGDEIRARNAGDTRAQMRPQDISLAYDLASGNRPEQQAMAQAYVQRERADSPIMMGMADTVRQFAKGVPVLGGIADEFNAGISSLTGGDSYEKSLDYQRARDSVFEEAHPIASTGLQLAGGVASGMGAAAKIAPLVGNASRAAIMGTGVGGGSTLGAADGFTRGEGMQDRLVQAGVGGALGAGIGGLAPIAGKGISIGAQTILDGLSTNRDIAKMGLDRTSSDILTRALSADGTLGARGAANIAKAGPDGMLADAGGNAAAILDTAIQRGGPGATLANTAIAERAARAGNQVDDALNASLGRPRESAARDLVVYGDKTRPLDLIYKRAYETPINYSHPEGMRLESLVQGRVPPSVIERANTLMRVEGAESRQILARVADDGSVVFERQPDVRQLDYITRALNDVAKAGDGKGALGGNTAEGRAYGNLSRDIRQTLRGLVPEYGQALDRASDEIGKIDALKFGGGLLSRGVTRDEVAREVAGMSQAQLNSMKQGVRDHIDETVANVKKTLSDPNLDARQSVQALRDLSSDAAREKIGAVIGKAESERLFGQIDQAARAFELRAATTQNSKTFARTVTNDTIKEASEPGAIGTLMQGKPVGATQRLLQALMGTGPQAQTAKQDKTYEMLVRALTGPTGPAAEKFAHGLEGAYKRRANNEMLARALGVMGSGAASGAGLGTGGFGINGVLAPRER
jgi:hypothetical protein